MIEGSGHDLMPMPSSAYPHIGASYQALTRRPVDGPNPAVWPAPPSRHLAPWTPISPPSSTMASSVNKAFGSWQPDTRPATIQASHGGPSGVMSPRDLMPGDDPRTLMDQFGSGTVSDTSTPWPPSNPAMAQSLAMGAGSGASIYGTVPGTDQTEQQYQRQCQQHQRSDWNVAPLPYAQSSTYLEVLHEPLKPVFDGDQFAMPASRDARPTLSWITKGQWSMVS